jgi:hypothetical protein
MRGGLVLDWDFAARIDHDQVNGHFARFEFQAELFLESLE